MQQCNIATMQQCTDITKHEGNTMKLIQQCNIATILHCNSAAEIVKQRKDNATMNNATLQQCYRDKKQRKHDEANTTVQYRKNAIPKQCYRDYETNETQ